MLIIRDEQMRMLGNKRFAEGMAALIREEFHDAADVPAAKLREEISQLVEIAAGYGLDSEQHTATFVITAWVMGGDFDKRFPAALAVLASDDFTADEKAEWLEEWVDTVLISLEGEED